MTSWTTSASSPVGRLHLVARADGCLTHLLFDLGDRPPPSPVPLRRDPGAFAEVLGELEEYFAGTRRAFDVPLAPRGSAFQLAAWRALQLIPHGETRSYAWQAAAMGRPGAARAVGAANGRNPLAIVVPCHRVIGADGRLTGYGGGVDRKRRLLALEQDQVGQQVLPLPPHGPEVAT